MPMKEMIINQGVPAKIKEIVNEIGLNNGLYFILLFLYPFHDHPLSINVKQK